MWPVLTVAHLTFAEARRKKILAASLICGLAFVALFALGLTLGRNGLRLQAPLQRQVAFTLLTILGLFAANFLSVLFAALLPIDTLSGEIDSGVMQTLAAKPIRRSDIVLGKFLGHWVIVIAYLLLMCSLVMVITAAAGRTVRIDLLRALPLLALELTVMMAISVAGGTRFTTITNGVVALGFYGVAFLGGWLEQIGSLSGLAGMRTAGVAASLVSPADVMWRLGLYTMLPAIARGTQNLGPFATNSVANPLMVWWTVAFTLSALAYAIRTFNRRAL
jgi:ABC-type transport system involved in multi-copper enzyme maturation permease subunit